MKAFAPITPALCLLLAACASAPPATVVPDTIKAGAGEKAAFVRHARGVQIYRCDAVDGGAMRWVFVAPEAQLFESIGASSVLCTHGAGPFWQAGDVSRTVGKVAARADAPQPAADIPWLLLTTTSSGSPGQMAAVSSIQRVRTAGGVAPATGCAVAADGGKTARVPYTSDYVFFVRG